MNKIVNDDQAYLRIEHLSKVYATRDGEVRALSEISFAQRRGEFISHVGPSGCGKSTLLMIAAGLLPPTSGAVRVDGRTVDRPRTDIGIVFQSPVLLDWRTALGNIMLQAEARQMNLKDAETRARELLTKVGLDGFEKDFLMSCRAACANASQSAARSSTTPIICSWTSRLGRSTP